jgi:hypothetical protein
MEMFIECHGKKFKIECTQPGSWWVLKVNADESLSPLHVYKTKKAALMFFM